MLHDLHVLMYLLVRISTGMLMVILMTGCLRCASLGMEKYQVYFVLRVLGAQFLSVRDFIP